MEIKIGDKFGDWEIISNYLKKDKRIYCECRCKCGIIKNVLRFSLLNNSSTQCQKCHNQYVAKTYLFDDLSGKIFGEWKVIKKVENTTNNKTTKYLCKCNCGKYKKVKRDSLTSGRSTKCRKCNGYRSLNGTLWSCIKQGATKRKIQFNITIKYAWSLYKLQKGQCALTKRKIIFKKGNKNRASLDRIDSSKGYIEGNVQWVHKDINIMKQSYSQEYFIELCKDVAKNFKND